MYRRTLIAVDPEGLVAGAAPAVARLAAPGGAKVRLVTVDKRTGRARPLSASPAGEEFIGQLAREFRVRDPIEVESRTRSGEPIADAIAASARAFGADLVVVGSHRRGDVGGFFASVGHALAARMSTPILVASHVETRSPADLRQVLVAVDGGMLSQQAVFAAVALAGPRTEVTAVWVDNSSGGLGAYPLAFDATPAQVEGPRALDDAVDFLRDAGAAASSRRVSSRDGTAAAIVRTADELDADLIVLGSRRPGNLEALLLGSVAHDVIACTRRTVLIASGGRHAGKPNPSPTALLHTC